MKRIYTLFLEQEDCDGNFETTMPYVSFSVFKTQTVKIYVSTGILTTLLKHGAASSRYDTNENPLISLKN